MSFRALSFRAARSVLPRVSAVTAAPLRNFGPKVDAKVAANLAVANANAAALGDKNMNPSVSLRLDLNVLKDAPAIEEKPDAEYPAWLWTVHNPLPTLFELQKSSPDLLTDQMKKRLFKLERRKDIKAANGAKAK